jgi:hypothetical protein
MLYYQEKTYTSSNSFRKRFFKKIRGIQHTMLCQLEGLTRLFFPSCSFILFLFSIFSHLDDLKIGKWIGIRRVSVINLSHSIFYLEVISFKNSLFAYYKSIFCFLHFRLLIIMIIEEWEMKYVKNFLHLSRNCWFVYGRFNYNRIINIVENLLCRCYAKRKCQKTGRI